MIIILFNMGSIDQNYVIVPLGLADVSQSSTPGTNSGAMVTSKS